MPLPAAKLVLGMVFDTRRLQPPRARARPERKATTPSRPDPHAPPLSRAPPIGFPSNLF
jgi:hypothetical protein